MGVVSITTGAGRTLRASGLCGTNFTGGNWILPARSSMSNMPRHTMSRKAPLGCFHCHASHSFVDSVRRLSRVRGDQFSYIKDVFLGDHPAAVLEFHQQQYESPFLERKGVSLSFTNFYFSSFTRRHIGAARTRDTSPAAISNCAS